MILVSGRIASVFVDERQERRVEAAWLQAGKRVPPAGEHPFVGYNPLLPLRWGAEFVRALALLGERQTDRRSIGVAFS